MSDPIPAELAVDAEPFDDAQLDAALEHVDEPFDDEPPQIVQAVSTFSIDDDGLAEWALRKVAGWDREISEAGERAEEWRRRIDVWFEQHSATLNRRAEYLRGRLEDYALRRRAADPKAKTTTLPSGTIRTTLRSEAIEIVDADYVLEWAIARAPQIIDRTVKVSDLRTVAEIRQDVVGAVISTRFDCGHSVVVHQEADSENVDRLLASGPVTEADGEVAACRECSDVLADVMVHIVEQHVEPWFASVVVDSEGEPIDGVAVKPAHVSAKVVGA